MAQAHKCWKLPAGPARTRRRDVHEPKSGEEVKDEKGEAKMRKEKPNREGKRKIIKNKKKLKGVQHEDFPSGHPT